VLFNDIRTGATPHFKHPVARGFHNVLVFVPDRSVPLRLHGTSALRGVQETDVIGCGRVSGEPPIGRKAWQMWHDAPSIRGSNVLRRCRPTERCQLVEQGRGHVDSSHEPLSLELPLVSWVDDQQRNPVADMPVNAVPWPQVLFSKNSMPWSLIDHDNRVAVESRVRRCCTSS